MRLDQQTLVLKQLWKFGAILFLFRSVLVHWECLLGYEQDSDAALLANRQKLISKASVRKLSERIQKLPLAEKSKHVCDFHDAMAGELNPIAWKYCVLAILNGHINVLARIKSQNLFGELLVDQRQLQAVRRASKVTPLPNVTVSGIEAANMLGLSISLMNGAVHMGLINAQKISQKIEIPLSEVARFRDDFIVASEI